MKKQKKPQEVLVRYLRMKYERKLNKVLNFWWKKIRSKERVIFVKKFFVHMASHISQIQGDFLRNLKERNIEIQQKIQIIWIGYFRQNGIVYNGNTQIFFKHLSGVFVPKK